MLAVDAIDIDRDRLSALAFAVVEGAAVERSCLASCVLSFAAETSLRSSVVLVVEAFMLCTKKYYRAGETDLDLPGRLEDE